jgi:hypothetical protein
VVQGLRGIPLRPWLPYLGPLALNAGVKYLEPLALNAGVITGTKMLADCDDVGDWCADLLQLPLLVLTTP